MPQTKTGAAGLAVLFNVILILLKMVVGVISGSISIIAQAIDSILDLFASLFIFFSLRFAAKPADREHPFGHGKMESFSGVVQAALIFAAAAYILHQSITRIISGAEIEYVTAGIVVLAVCIAVDIFLSRYLFSVSRKSESVALDAYARNITTDIFTMSGVLLGLVMVQVTGINIIDPIIAIGVSLLILKTAYDVLRKSFPHLIDVKLPDEEERIIEAVVGLHVGPMGEAVSFHKLRTRKSGCERHVELHLVMAAGDSIEKAHVLCDCLEEDIRSKLSNIHVTIHVEPCDWECSDCHGDCPQEPPVQGP